jgi:hypothetical protein
MVGRDVVVVVVGGPAVVVVEPDGVVVEPDVVVVESDGAVFPGTIGAVGAGAQPVSSNTATSAAPSAPALSVPFAFAFIHRALRLVPWFAT